MTGCRNNFSGIGGGPSGLAAPPEADRFIEGCFLIFATDPSFSRAPPVIQALITSSLAAGSLSWLGGILGSSACETKLQSRELSGSPGSRTGPVEPPWLTPAKLASERSLFLVS